MIMNSTLFPFEDFDDDQKTGGNKAVLQPFDTKNDIHPLATANENALEIEVFSKEILDNAIKEAFDKGKAAGIVEGKSAAAMENNVAQEKLNQKIAAALESLNIQLATLFDTTEQYSPTRIVPHIQQLSLGIAHKVVGNELKEHIGKEVEDYINRSLTILFDQPLLTIYLHPELEANMLEKVKELAVRNNFRGEVQIKPDPQLSETDCRIDWHEGFSELSKTDLWKSIEEIFGDTIY